MTSNSIPTKRCTRCKRDKPFEAFNKSKGGRFGLHAYCRECHGETTKKWYRKTHVTRRAHAAERYQKRDKAARRERWHKDPLYRESRMAHNAKYRKTATGKRWLKQWHQKRRNDPIYRIIKTIRSRIGMALRRCSKTGSSIELIGCSIDHLKAHLESLWQPGMSWDNHGRGKGKQSWHIDHIVPCSAFDLTKPDEQRKCFHWTNLQPLWAGMNCKKRNYVPDYQI